MLIVIRKMCMFQVCFKVKIKIKRKILNGVKISMYVLKKMYIVDSMEKQFIKEKGFVDIKYLVCE